MDLSSDANYYTLEWNKEVIIFTHKVFLTDFFDEDYNDILIKCFKMNCQNWYDYQVWLQRDNIKPNDKFKEDFQYFKQNLRYFLFEKLMQANPRLAPSNIDHDSRKLQITYQGATVQSRTSILAFIEVYKLLQSLYKQNTKQLSINLWTFIKKIIFDFTEKDQEDADMFQEKTPEKSQKINWFSISKREMFLRKKTSFEKPKEEDKFLTVEKAQFILKRNIVENINDLREKQFPNDLTEDEFQIAEQIFKYNTPFIQQLISKCYGDLYQPDVDVISKLGFDMFAYLSKPLHKEVIDLISKHFTQIYLIGKNLQHAVLMLNTQSCNVVKNIKQLKRQFMYYTSGIRLPENTEALEKIIFALKTKDLTRPALTDYIFADDTSIRCEKCPRWYVSNEKALQCCRQEINSKVLDKTSIKSSNQDLLRLLKVHVVIAQFIFKQSLSSSFKGYLKKEQELLTFKYAYEFLYYFVLNNKQNQVQLSDLKYLNLFWSHLEIPELAEDSIRLLTEIIRDNDLANQLIQNYQLRILGKLLHPQKNQFKRRISVIIQSQLQLQQNIESVQSEESSQEECEFIESDQSDDQEILQIKDQQTSNPFAEVKSPTSTKILYEQNIYPVEVLELLKVLVISDQGIKSEKVSVVSEIVMNFLNCTEFYPHLLFLMESKELFQKKRKYNLQYLLELSQKQPFVLKGSNLDFHLSFVDLLGILTLGAGEAVETFLQEHLFRHEDMIDLATSNFPLHIKQPFVRYCHGVYFSEKGEEEEAQEGVFGMQQIVEYLLREDGKYVQQMLTNFIQDIKQLIVLYGTDEINQLKEYNQYVYQVLLPFITQLHSEGHLFVLKDTENDISQGSKDKIAQMFDDLVLSVIELCQHRQSTTYDNRKTALIAFLNAFIKSKTVFDKKLARNDPNTMINLRQQIQVSICANSEDIKSLNQIKLTRFILRVCLPKILQLYNDCAQEILLEKNPSKELIMKEIQLLRHEQNLVSIDYSYYVLVQLIRKLIFDVKSKQQRLIEKDQEEDQNPQQLDYQNLVKQAFQTKLEKAGYKIEHKEYQNHIKGGQIILKHLLIQCQSCYETNIDFCLYFVQVFQSILILCGAIVRSINETQIEVSEYETPKELLQAQSVFTEDGVQFVVNFVSQIKFPLSSAAKLLLKEVMKFSIALTSYGNSLVQKELIGYYSTSCNQQQEGANFLTNIKNLFSQQSNDLSALIPDEQLQQVTIFILRFLKN